MVKRAAALALLLLPLLALMIRTEPATLSARIPPQSRARAGKEAPGPAARAEKRPAAPGDAAPNIEVAVVDPSEPPLEFEVYKPKALLWLARHQNEDGSWGETGAMLDGRFIGRAGITAQVLLSMLGAGYSQLSKDEYDGIKLGDSIRRALKWMLRDQRADGGFASSFGTFDQALATLALNEGYGMTAAAWLKDPARKALDALIGQQYPDGSWGPDAISVTAMHALASAALNELEFPYDAKSGALRHAAASDHPGMTGARIVLAQQKATRDSPEAAALLQSRPADDDLAGWLHTTTSIYVSEGLDGVHWKVWKGLMIQAVANAQAPDGSCPGGSESSAILRTCLATQLLQIYYRYSNITSTASK